VEDQMVKIKQNFKVAQNRKKIYEDKNARDREFKVGENLILKVKSKKRSLKLGSCTKITSRLCGPFEILDRIRLVAYMFTLLASMNMNNVFHVSFLKKYVHDINHVIDWNLIQLELE
jgi:hypothetical protein